MHKRFGLVLTVTRACNLRCSYCYMGGKASQTMDHHVGCTAIDRAVRSIQPDGTLELGFFGGEPLLAATNIVRFLRHARWATLRAGIHLEASLTTNGTVTDGAAWQVMTSPEMQLSISHDGLPEIHDRYRRTVNGQGSAEQVIRTIRRYLETGKSTVVVMVVRPDTVDRLPEGIAWLREQGVRHVAPSLDLWSQWDRPAAKALQAAIIRCADLWHEGLPECGISWFDEKAARIAGSNMTTARCGFGNGEVAVSVAGHLYPCERLIGEDAADGQMRLPGSVLEGEDFLNMPVPAGAETNCSSCRIESECNTFCRCSNYVRTGDVNQPDGLLCLWNRTCYDETLRVMHAMSSASSTSLPVLASSC